MKKRLLLGMMLLVLFATPALALTYSLTSTEDTTIDYSSQDRNWPNGSHIGCQGQGDGTRNFDTVMKFNLSSLPSDASIESTMLYLYCFGGRSKEGWAGAGTAHAYKMTDGWTEETVTWNNAPSMGNEVDAHSGNWNEWWDWNFTNYAVLEFNGDKVISLRLREPGTLRSERFFSKESLTRRPRLEIQFTTSESESDNNQAVCESNGHTWFTGTISGSNGPCCGDDGSADDFYSSSEACIDGEVYYDADEKEEYCTQEGYDWMTNTGAGDYEIIYEEDFNDGSAQGWTIDSGSCGSDSGIRSTGACGGDSPAICPEPYGDYFLEATGRDNHYSPVFNSSNYSRVFVNFSIASESCDSGIEYAHFRVYDGYEWYDIEAYHNLPTSGTHPTNFTVEMTRYKKENNQLVFDTHGLGHLGCGDHAFLDEVTIYGISNNHCCGDDGSGDYFDNTTHECINGEFGISLDGSQSDCEAEGYTWFTGTVGGSNGPCCGDDGSADDFYNSSLACVDANITSERDELSGFCKNGSYLWVEGSTQGSNAACCGDDGGDDLFYNTTHLCDSGALLTDSDELEEFCSYQNNTWFTGTISGSNDPCCGDDDGEEFYNSTLACNDGAVSNDRDDLQIFCEDQGHEWINESHYPGTYSFTDDVVGSLPDGFAFSTTSTGSIEVVSAFGGRSKVARHYVPSGEDGTSDMRLESMSEASNTVEFWWRTDEDVYSGSPFWVNDGVNWDTGFGISVQDDGEFIINFWGGDTYSSGYTYTPGDWVHLKVWFDSASDTVKLFINGVLYVEATRSDGFPTPATYVFGSRTQYGYSYYDAIGLASDPDYNIGDNLVAPCCGDDGSSDDFYNNSLACVDGGVISEKDDSQAFCETTGHNWFTGSTTGSNSPCCGDDGSSDDFYNDTLACNDGVVTNDGDDLQIFCEGAGYTWIDNITGVDNDWLEPSFYNRKSFDISSNESLTNQPVNVTLDTSTLISNGDMQSDCSDVRVYDADNSQELDYYVGNCNDADTRIWFPINISAGVSKTVDIYYGNDNAVSEATTSFFIYYEGFNTASLPSGWSWTCHSKDGGDTCGQSMSSDDPISGSYDLYLTGYSHCFYDPWDGVKTLVYNDLDLPAGEYMFYYYNKGRVRQYSYCSDLSKYYLYGYTDNYNFIYYYDEAGDCNWIEHDWKPYLGISNVEQNPTVYIKTWATDCNEVYMHFDDFIIMKSPGNANITFSEGVAESKPDNVYCCGDDGTDDNFYNSSMACVNGSVTSDKDEWDSFCEAGGFTWFTGTLEGVNDPCCGDDGSSDGFGNSTHCCKGGSFEIGECTFSSAGCVVNHVDVNDNEDVDSSDSCGVSNCGSSNYLIDSDVDGEWDGYCYDEGYSTNCTQSRLNELGNLPGFVTNFTVQVQGGLKTYADEAVPQKEVTLRIGEKEYTTTTNSQGSYATTFTDVPLTCNTYNTITAVFSYQEYSYQSVKSFTAMK